MIALTQKLYSSPTKRENNSYTMTQWEKKKQYFLQTYENSVEVHL